MELTRKTQTKIIPALIEARKSITGVVKGEANPFFKSKYADLPSVIQAVNQPLLDNDLIVTQPTQSIDGVVYLVTEITHVSGEWKRGYLPVLNKKPNDPQGQGSAITYARRYGLLAMLNIPTFDDDGEIAMARNHNEPETKAQPTLEEHDDIPYDAPQPKVAKKITKPQRTALINYVNEMGVSQEAAVQLLKANGYEQSSDVTQDRLEFIKSEIARIGAEMKEVSHA